METRATEPNVTPVRAVLRIHGQVQGVGFRAAALDKARELGINGFVRNLRDGSVESVAEGPFDAVNTYVAWCHHGPRAATVREVGVVWGIPMGEQGFRIIRS